MHYTAWAVLFTIVSLVNAQGIPNVPQCSLQCFTTALMSDGCSSLTDFACHCQKQTLASQITSCVQSACSPADQQTVLETVQETCKQAGHPITVAIPSTGAGGSSTAASSPVSSQSAPAPTSATETSASSSTASSSESAPTSESTSGAASSTSAAATTTSSPTESSASATAASASSAASTFAGAATINNVQPVGGFGAMLLAIAAYLA